METFTVIWNVIAEAAGFWMEHLIFINILLSIVIVFFEPAGPQNSLDLASGSVFYSDPWNFSVFHGGT